MDRYINWLEETLEEKKQWLKESDDSVAWYTSQIKWCREHDMPDLANSMFRGRARMYRERAKDRKRIAYWEEQLRQAREKYGE